MNQPLKQPLSCVHCGASAVTWAHVDQAQDDRDSRPGNRIFDFVPLCRNCSDEQKAAKLRCEHAEPRVPHFMANAVKRTDGVEDSNFGHTRSLDRIYRQFTDLAARHEQVNSELRKKIDELGSMAAQIRSMIKPP